MAIDLVADRTNPALSFAVARVGLKMQHAPHEILALAALSHCDVRTIQKALRGGPIRESSRIRIAEALAKLGMQWPAPVSSEAK